MQKEGEGSWGWVKTASNMPDTLRPIVLKHKVSFGSKTQKGADVMSVLLSVCLTL